jgi:hypothetical protein
LLAAVCLVALLAAATASAAANFFDVQANKPQVSGSPLSDANAKFPTNKQNEPTIALNPLDSRYLIAGSNDEQEQPPCGPGPVRGTTEDSDCSFFPGVGTSGIYTSSDGGKTWTNRGLLDDQPGWKASPFVSDGDPVIVYGPKPNGKGGFSFANGARAYYATLASYKDGQNPFQSFKAPELLAVSYSDDNGLSWSAPVASVIKDNPNDFNDKEAIWADKNPSSPFFGRVYISWTQFRSATATGNGNAPVMVAYSADGGNTFSAPNQLSPAANNGGIGGRQGSAVRTGPDGSAYVAFEQYTSQVVAISRDGGVSWTQPITIGTVTDLADPIPGSNFRTDSFLSIAPDPRQGNTTIYAAWANRTAAGGRIVVSTSTDKGLTWGAPVTVSGSEGYAFYQGLDVAPNGRVDLAYQVQTAKDATTYGTGNAAINSWFVSNSGKGWTKPVKISSASSDPAATAQNNLQRQFYGDYNTLVSDNNHAWFIYTDARNGVGCPAVDQYQHYLNSIGAVLRDDDEDEITKRNGKDPYAEDPSVKPAPGLVCPAQYGNSDAYVSVVTP